MYKRQVIPGASIHVVKQGTNAKSDTKTNNVGFYQVPGLFTGIYTVTISAPNMKTEVQTIELLVDQHAVINPVMTPGAETQRVEVNANTVELTTTAVSYTHLDVYKRQGSTFRNSSEINYLQIWTC